MIFVAVGTQKFPFNRLIEAIDRLIDEGKIKEEVFAQIGNSTYKPKNFPCKEFLGKDEFQKYMDDCSLIVTHSGVATIIEGLRKEKPIIVMPRLAKYGEHVDDHQVQIADSFKDLNFIFECGEDDNLAGLINDARTHRFDKYVSQQTKMIKVIRNYINKIGK
jgi:UDP-N-acetylglucosamine transferase subunit ALG13